MPYNDFYKYKKKNVTNNTHFKFKQHLKIKLILENY